MEALIQLRRGTAAQWISVNPVLASGEPGVETDTGKGKVGNGTQNWLTLPYSWNATTVLPSDSVGSIQIIDGSVGQAELANGAVTTVKIADLAVTNGKLAANAVTTDKILDGTIALADLDPATIAALGKSDVYDEGTAVTAGASILDFVGAGVTVDSPVAGRARVTVTGAPASAIIPGTMAHWYDNGPPAGWYICDGTVKADLAGTLGTRYGAVAGTLPNIAPVPIDATVTTASSIFTPASGWTLSGGSARMRDGVVYLNVSLSRSGANIPLGNPNHADQTMATVKAPWIPASSVGLVGYNALRHGVINTTGAVNLTAGLSNHDTLDADILRDDFYSFYTVYPIDPTAAASMPRTWTIMKNNL